MNAQQNTKVWFITGSSTGFGRILAETILGKGDRKNRNSIKII